MILGLSWQAWYTILVVLALFSTLCLTKLRADVAFLCAMVVLFVPGVLTPDQAFGGFVSDSVLVIGAMFCVIAGLDHTGVLNWIVRHLLGNPKSHKGAIVRVMAPVAVLSSVLSNTTVVALFVGIVKKWTRKLGISPSKLLIPLSYAAGMGGICTLIGTPPNLLISGMLAKETGSQLGIFAPFLCGLFCLVVGVISMLLMRNLLPDRKTPLDSASEAGFSTELEVPSDNLYIGWSLADACKDAGIEFDSSKFIAIRRFDGLVESPLGPDNPIMGTDHILVDGTAVELKRISQKMGFRNEFLEAAVEQDDEVKKQLEDSCIGPGTCSGCYLVSIQGHFTALCMYVGSIGHAHSGMLLTFTVLQVNRPGNPDSVCRQHRFGNRHQADGSCRDDSRRSS